MKFLGLVRASLLRKKTRTFLTIGSIMIAFLMFGLLSALEKAFTAGVDIAGADRLVTIHKVSLIQSMPLSYYNRIRAVEGVREVTHATWFGGYFKETRNFIATFPVEAESYMKIYPELEMPPEQYQAWMDDRTGMVVGYALAERYGWQVGDRIPIRSEIYRQADGSDTWDMTLRGIYRPKDDLGDPTALMMHYDYFNESLPEGNRDNAGWFTIQVADPDQAVQIAAAVDGLFINSSTETKTSTEKAFAAGFASQIGNIGAIVIGIVTAVFFTMLLVTANTMGQSVRERTNELAVLKTLGFTSGRVTVLVMIEALSITLIGGLLGMGLAWLIIEGLGDKLRQFLPVFYLPENTLIVSVLLMLLFGLVAGALPAGQAMRLRIADALRKGA